MGLLEFLALWFAISCVVALWIGWAIGNANKDPESSSDQGLKELASDDHEGAPLTKQGTHDR